MLPHGFTWHPYVGGPALYIDGIKVAIAMVANFDSGGCRVEINPSLDGRRSRFFDDEATARTYVEAWARKWEAKLREQYARFGTRR